MLHQSVPTKICQCKQMTVLQSLALFVCSNLWRFPVCLPPSVLHLFSPLYFEECLMLMLRQGLQAISRFLERRKDFRWLHALMFFSLRHAVFLQVSLSLSPAFFPFREEVCPASYHFWSVITNSFVLSQIWIKSLHKWLWCVRKMFSCYEQCYTWMIRLTCIVGK